MFAKIGLAGLALAAAAGLAGCADDYGYGGVQVGYNGGYGGYDGGYGGYGGGYGYGYDGGYDGYYDAGYGNGSFGWFGDYYYPGTGYYVYDRYRRPYRWNDGQRRYWEGRRAGNQGGARPQANWQHFDRGQRQGFPDRPGFDDRQGIANRRNGQGYAYRQPGQTGQGYAYRQPRQNSQGQARQFFQNGQPAPSFQPQPSQNAPAPNRSFGGGRGQGGRHRPN